LLTPSRSDAGPRTTVPKHMKLIENVHANYEHPCTLKWIPVVFCGALPSALSATRIVLVEPNAYT
jgi:hypothetical protein